jgi:cysteinyl-tRNA synthetase
MEKEICMDEHNHDHEHKYNQVDSQKEMMAESILDDEGITDGLTDEDAAVILNWSFSKIESYSGGNQEKFMDKIDKIAKFVNKAAQAYIERGNARKAEKYLSKIWKKDKVARSLRLLSEADTVRAGLVELLDVADENMEEE